METSAVYLPADLRLALSYRTGLIAGTVAKWGQVELKAGLVPRVGEVLDHAIEIGLRWGWHRAYKHTDTPSEDDVRSALAEGVRNAIAEWFMIPDEHE